MAKSPYDTLGPNGEADIADLEEFFAMLAKFPTEWVIDSQGVVRTETSTEHPLAYCPLCYVARMIGRNKNNFALVPAWTELRIPWVLRNSIMNAADGLLLHSVMPIRKRLHDLLQPKRMV